MISPCLETNLYATPSGTAQQLTRKHRRHPIIRYLFQEIRPELVFAHSNEPIRFFEERTGRLGFTSGVKRTRWQGHDFWLFGGRGPLFRLAIKDAEDLGAYLAKCLGC
jgi:hypothetical protein